MIPVGFGYGEQSMSDPFQPFVSRAPNGFAGGVGNPMQDAFQRFLSAQGQGVVGTPPIRPMSDPFKMFDDGPMTQPTMGRDPFRRSDEGIPLWMQLGQPNPNQPVGIAGGVGTPAMGDYSMYAPEYRPGGQYGPTPPMGRDPFQPFTDNPVGLAGGTGTPPMGRNPFQPFTDNPVGVAGGVGNPMQDIFQQFTERQRQGAGGFGGPQTTMSPTVQPMAPPPAGGGLPYNDGFYNPTSAPRQPLTQPPAPMAMKKGGFAVKPVWDKKRPKDLGKPKDLSAKKEKSAKARAKAAGRPYPNLIDNMAVARKKGK